VLRLADAGIVFGCTDERYCPHDAVARGDLAAFLAAALGLESDGDPRFIDVPSHHPRAEAIAAVDEAGILRGFAGDRFGPDEPLERAQLATMLVQGFGIPEVSGPAPFGDVDEDGVHSRNIAAASTAGLTVGCDDTGRFCPWDDVSRGQIATFIDNALAYRG
jgi:hypothetical protein